MPQFHAKTFDLLPCRPAESAAALKSIDRLERRLGRALPASLREWYGCADACEILAVHSNDDLPVPLEELGRPEVDWETGVRRDLVTEGFLVFGHENQGVCTWALRLDGSEDPPVVVSFDSGRRDWRRCADSFSEHVYACVWDHSFVLRREPLILAQNAALSAQALERLRQIFELGVTTYGWPGHTQYRLRREDQYLLIRADDGQADWWLSADSEQSLSDAVSTVWQLDKVGDAFWSYSDAGQALLDRLRSAAG